MSKNLQNPFANIDPIAIFGTKTVIEVPVDIAWGKRRMFRIPNMPDGSVPFHVIKTFKVNGSKIGAWRRVEVAND